MNRCLSRCALFLFMIGALAPPSAISVPTEPASIVWSKKHEGDWTSQVAFSPDGKTLAVGVHKVVHLHRAKDGALLKTLTVPDTPLISGLAFSRDGKSLLIGRLKPQDKRVFRWDMDEGTMKEMPGDRPSSHVAASPVSNLFATSTYGFGVVIWREGRPSQVIGREYPTGFDLDFSSDGSMIASPTRRPERIRIWNVSDGRLLVTMGEDGFAGGDALAFSPDGKTLTAGSINSQIHLYRVEDGKRLKTMGTAQPGREGSVTSVAFSRDGKRLLATTKAHLRILNLEGDVLFEHREEKGNAIQSAAFSPDERHIAYCTRDGRVAVLLIPPLIQSQ